MRLNSRQIKYLRQQAQKRKAVVLVGNQGLSEAVLAEMRGALAHHELLKVRLPAAEPDQRRHMLESLCRELDAEPVQSIGRMAIIYRRADKPRLTLPL